ncbi:MAG: hypothetical protein II992_03710 [Lachnospiraceae bacterium]|nr:hypothetical protein [Lachnospiraceae bacterium]
MRATKSAFIILVTVLCVGFIFSDVTTVEAAKKPKARVTNVSGKVSGKKNIKITFKKDKKAKKYGIKKYKVKLTQYNYIEKTNKWKKGKVTYKTVSAYKGKKLKNTVSVTVKNKKVSNKVAYKVQVASANKNGVTKTSYTTSKEIGCFHDWLWESKTHEVEVKAAVTEKVTENKCDGCGMTGTLKVVSEHCTTYTTRRSDEYYNYLKAFCQDNNLNYSTFDLDSYITDDSNRLKFENYVISYLNKKYGYTTRLYTASTLPAPGVVTGCTGASSTGNYIEVEISPAEYQTVTKQVGTCQHCNKEWIKD